MRIREVLTEAERAFDGGLDPRGVSGILTMLGSPGLPPGLLDDGRIYSECLPMSDVLGFSTEQRCLHFLWDSIDRLPCALIVDLSFPLRRMIAECLFKSCGSRFNAEENVRFNFGQNIDAGDDVFINRNTFLDSKGGISLGDSVGIGENVMIFTHSHSESAHDERRYAKVTIKAFAKIYSCSMVLPGVTVGERAIVAAKSLVTKDVASNTVVAGMPARPLRERATCGRTGPELRHIWLKDGVFQLEEPHWDDEALLFDIGGAAASA